MREERKIAQVLKNEEKLIRNLAKRIYIKGTIDKWVADEAIKTEREIEEDNEVVIRLVE